jgi:carboxyl-terminal processing protease
MRIDSRFGTAPRAARCAVATMLAVLAACGGGGSSANNGAAGSGGPTTWTPGSFPPADSYYARCTAPRSGVDPATGLAYSDVPGTVNDQNNWLRSWSNDLYLWYDEVQDADPALYATLDYFDLLKTFATTPSGSPKDKFHFTYPTADWEALSQSGVTAGYGAEWVILADTPPRELVVAYTEPNTPATAAAAHLVRGAEVLAVDGVDLVYANDQASIETLNYGLWPFGPGETHTFTVRDLGSAGTRVVTLRSESVTSTPVQNVHTVADPFGTIGYMLFNDHIATAEQGLINAIAQLRAAAITDLVLDLRYNGGGYLDIASELAYMIAGPGFTAGVTFEELRFNGKHPVTNPVTGAALAPVPFHSTAQGFSVPFGQALPTLNLARVFVLTGPDTCSASESVINSLRGADVEVIQIGSTTCGKPYGFYPADNCGTTYFTIQFKGVNAKGYGDYTDGFAPGANPAPMGAVTPGCFVEDDFTHALGDPGESRFGAALEYRAGAGCPAQRVQRAQASTTHLAAVDGRTHKSPWLQNRTLRR